MPSLRAPSYLGLDLSFYLNHGYVAKVTNERLGGVAAATSREFTSGQKVFGCYDIHLFLDERGFDWKLSDFHRQRSHRMRTNFIGFFANATPPIPACPVVHA